MKKLNLFRMLVLMTIGMCLASSTVMAKASGSSRRNPAARDSSVLYSRLEMQEMGHESRKGKGTKKIQADSALKKAPTSTSASTVVTPQV